MNLLYQKLHKHEPNLMELSEKLAKSEVGLDF